MSQVKAVDRGVTLIKFVLGLLKSHPEGKRPRDLYAEIEAKLPLDAFDKEILKGSGLPRWRALLHFHSVAASKAGLLAKSDGQWLVTEEGLKAAELPDDELKRLMRSRYREWRWGQPRAKPGAETVATVEEPPPLSETSVLFEDAKEKARAEIDEYLDTLSGYEFQDLVAALLEGMGYATSSVSKPGADGGTDILAYTDPLGAQTPHIRVQVKHRDQAASREDVAALRGIMRGDREIGLFVSSGGFTREARREAGIGAVHIELVDLDRFLMLWQQHYGKIPEAKRSKLRLEPVYFLAP
ncbi:Mrr restriction system protein [Bradyrhizobium sp. 83002]|uniref:restriction endonuclease n=1 Tax=Bradyrhizobium aeschynomenes TaxID=2734909 RepID=UPI0015532D11|nr:restriction endonuclease [Bradyrhizobium aeschynomenes]NPU11768.1 Mrr restriction system protein [Bradyrhizobium aeschynomenes]